MMLFLSVTIIQLTRVIRQEALALVGAERMPVTTTDVNGLERQYFTHILPDFAGPARYDSHQQPLYQPDWNSAATDPINTGFISALTDSVAAALVRNFSGFPL